MTRALLPQPENPLGGTEPVERVDLQELVDDLAAGVTDLGCLGAAPDGGLHLEGDLLRRVVAPVGAFSLVKCRVGLDQVAVEEDLHHGGGGADVDLAADQFPGHGVEGAADLDDVRADGGRRPAGQRERGGRQRQQGGGLNGAEQGHRRHPAQWPALPAPGDLLGPGDGLGLHVLDRGELPPTPERVANLGHGPLHPGLALRLQGSRRIHQRPVMGGEFGIRFVDFRVVEVGLVDAGLQVVGHQTARDASDMRKAATCASVHACWSRFRTGRTNMCREQGSTITNAQTRCRFPVRGLVH